MRKSLFLVSLILITLFSCEKDKPEVQKPIIVATLNGYPISALVMDNSDVLWVGTDSGLFMSDPEGFRMVDTQLNSEVTSLAIESGNNTLWIGTKTGLSKINMTSLKAIIIPDSSLSSSSVNSVYVDGNTDKWFGTNPGLTRNSNTTWQKTNFKKNAIGTITPLDFEVAGINSIASWDGDYYFATAGQRLYRTFGWNAAVDAFTGATQWESPYNGQALSDTMYVVFVDSKSQQWMGGKEGIQVHMGHDPKAENLSFYDELVNPKVHCVAEAPNGDIWVGTENGISVYDGLVWTAHYSSLPDKLVTAIAFGQNGKVWIGTKKGLVSE